MDVLSDQIKSMIQGIDIDGYSVSQSIDFMMAGDADPVQAGAFLSLLARNGETATQIEAAARVMRSHLLPVPVACRVADCCGTGGDGAHTYNISTAVALVAASCGIPMAKHGNRASSSKCGGADVLEALGVNLDISVEKAAKAIETLGFAFLMAPLYHPALKHVAPVRKRLGIRTIFNLLGPLTNPANAKTQLLGVYDPKWCEPMAQTLKALGSHSAWVVHGHPGIDEISISGGTHVTSLQDNGRIESFEITPADFGLPIHDPAALRGGNADENAVALRALLSGAPGAYRDAVLINSAALLHIYGLEDDLANCTKIAAQAIDSNKTLQLLDAYIEWTQREGA